jgi:hypothetical protein
MSCSHGGELGQLFHRHNPSLVSHAPDCGGWFEHTVTQLKGGCFQHDVNTGRAIHQDVGTQIQSIIISILGAPRSSVNTKLTNL